MVNVAGVILPMLPLRVDASWLPASAPEAETAHRDRFVASEVDVFVRILAAGRDIKRYRIAANDAGQ